MGEAWTGRRRRGDDMKQRRGLLVLVLPSSLVFSRALCLQSSSTASQRSGAHATLGLSMFTFLSGFVLLSIVSFICSFS